MQARAGQNTPQSSVTGRLQIVRRTRRWVSTGAGANAPISWRHLPLDFRSPMIETPHVAQTAEQLTVYIHLTTPRTEMQKVMGPGIREILAVIAAQGIAPAGPWFTHHLKMAPDIFDFEISVPVKAPIAPAGRDQPGKFQAGKVG